MRRRIPSILSKPLRAFDTPLGVSLETFVWLPARKERDSNTEQVITREVLSAAQAKQYYGKRVRRVDPWGHTAAKIHIDCSVATEESAELIDKIRELAIDHNAVSPQDSIKITGLDCYLSLSPDHNRPPRDKLTPSDEQEWIERTKTGDSLTDLGKQRSLLLFNTKYPAHNGNYKGDVDGYGIPDSTQLFSRNLNFSAIVEQCYKMMIPVVKGNTLVLETALPSAAYFGKAMLDEHRLISKMLQNEEQPFSAFNRSTEVIHVCTTASLILFKAGMGEDEYYNIVKKVLRDNPELTHGFPITHFADALFKAISLHPDYKLPNVADEKADLSNQGNTFRKT